MADVHQPVAQRDGAFQQELGKKPNNEVMRRQFLEIPWIER